MTRSIKQHNQLIAVNLIDTIKDIEKNPPKIKGFSIPRLEYLIHLIICNKQDNHPGAWSVLHMPYLRKIVPCAECYLRYLRDQGIIEWKNYSAGRNSRLYRLKVEGRTEFRRITDMGLINRIERIRRDLKRLNSKKYPKLNAYISKIRIDKDDAIKTTELKYTELKSIDPLKAASRRTFSLSEIDKINGGDIYIKCNSTNGRLDSNITRLPSELVKHVTLDGSSLIELDIRNSQPFFAASMMNPTPEVESVMNKYLGQKVTRFIKYMRLSECKDVLQYQSLVTSGSFYEPFMRDKLREAGLLYLDRNDLKRDLFVVFFGKSGAWKYNTVARVFKSSFPNVIEFLDKVKGKDYERLSIFLQRLESYTVLDRVVPRIIKDFPGLPFLTKHDSILPVAIMVPFNVDQVVRVIIEVVYEVTGLIPQVRVKVNEKLKISA